MSKICHEHCPGNSAGHGLLTVLAAAVLAAAVATVIAHLLLVLVIIVAVTAGLGVLGLAAVLITPARSAQARQLPAGRGQARIIASPAAARPARALPAPPRAIEAPRAGHQHLHLHLHGVSAQQLARVIRQAQDAAGPGAEDHEGR